MSGRMAFIAVCAGTDDRLCVLVVIGVNARGEKHFLAIEDGVRESTQSWREVLLGLKARSRTAPKRATSDAAMGFRSPRIRHRKRRFRQRHQAIKPGSGRRIMIAWTPDLTIAHTDPTEPSGSLDYFVFLDGLPLSSRHSRVKLGP